MSWIASGCLSIENTDRLWPLKDLISQNWLRWVYTAVGKEVRGGVEVRLEVHDSHSSIE